MFSIVGIIVIGLIFMFRKPSLEVQEKPPSQCTIKGPKDLKEIFVKTTHLKDLKVKKTLENVNRD